jgi:hypothetical protein
MKRNLDLIRKIVLSVEEHPHGYAPADLKFDGYDDETVGYHGFLLVDAGLAEGIDVAGLGSESPAYHVHRLTSAGHDFADAVRNDTVWNKTKTKLADVGSGVSLQVVTQLSTSFLKSMLGLS